MTVLLDRICALYISSFFRKIISALPVFHVSQQGEYFVLLRSVADRLNSFEAMSYA